MPVVTKSFIDTATFEMIEDRITFLKSSVVSGKLTEAQEPTTISDPNLPNLRSVTILTEIRQEPEAGDKRGVHHIAFYFTIPKDSPGDVKIDDVRISRGGVTLIDASDCFFKLERGLQKRIGITTDVVKLSNPAAIVEIDIGFNLYVSKIDCRL